MKQFLQRDLLVSEVEFAQQHRLTKKQYCEIKTKIYEEALRENHQQNLAKARLDVRASVKKEVTDELRPQIVADAEKRAMPDAIKKATVDLIPKMKEDAYKRYHEEWIAEKPSREDIEAFGAILREIEIDSLAFAMSASHEADIKEKASRVKSAFKDAGFFAGLILVCPAVIGFCAVAPVYSSQFWLMLTTYVIAFLSVAFWRPNINNVGRLRETSSNYLQLTSESKMLRLSIDTKTRGQIQNEIFKICNNKRRLDEEYNPSMKVLESVKPDVKIRLSDEIDPEKLLSYEFDERLMRAEDEKAQVYRNRSFDKIEQ